MRPPISRPVDLSVVRLEVFDPNGRLVRHYSSNVTVRNGRAEFKIPFALSDTPGDWRVRARDVVSGLVADQSWTLQDEGSVTRKN